ncbi:von Willebrand factor type A domain-containing protein [Fodinibius salinus]|uniref:von Willebrand factor type A domain-containing protein n=1 Tax=Fodinibius salinus TaxID=860790 RepID=A0A5D3YGR2_9BACT|nr:vWA domain-containing protein [Fodinibius salinus]TYP92742.1 von Willebrand factor type A domain-containing protein [Fodinibius salinus]
MTKYSTILYSTAILLMAGLFISCSNSTGTEEKPVEEALVVGTQVSSDFLNTGEFDVLGTPLDEDRKSILSDVVGAKITLDSLSGNTSSKIARKNSRVVFGKNKPVSDITVDIRSRAVNQAGNDPFAISLDIDGSGSMSNNDPNRTRVQGAKDFVDEFSQNASNFEISIFTYEGDPNRSFLSNSELLSEFSSNTSALKDSVDNVEASGGTPTYPSLLEVLEYSEQEKPHQSNERGIVLLSDGYPNSTALRDSVCKVANNMDSPIYSIGLGPASDLSNNPDPDAVQEMRDISTCTGGSYSGIDPNNNSVNASSLYRNIAIATSKGNIQFKAKLSGSGFSNLQPGTILYFTLKLATGNGQAEAFFSFSVPSTN